MVTGAFRRHCAHNKNHEDMLEWVWCWRTWVPWLHLHQNKDNYSHTHFPKSDKSYKVATNSRIIGSYKTACLWPNTSVRIVSSISSFVALLQRSHDASFEVTSSSQSFSSCCHNEAFSAMRSLSVFLTIICIHSITTFVHQRRKPLPLLPLPIQHCSEFHNHVVVRTLLLCVSLHVFSLGKAWYWCFLWLLSFIFLLLITERSFFSRWPRRDAAVKATLIPLRMGKWRPVFNELCGAATHISVV